MITRVFALLLFLSLQLSASQYNSTVIELEAKLFPKMLLLSENIKKHASTLHIVIIAKDSANYSARVFKENIEKNYAKKLQNREVVVQIKEFTDAKKSNADGVIVLYHSAEELTKIATWANEHKIPSFAYDPAHLEYGILASLYIGATTKPYLNKNTISKYNFSFDPYLLKLSKFYN